MSIKPGHVIVLDDILSILRTNYQASVFLDTERNFVPVLSAANLTGSLYVPLAMLAMGFGGSVAPGSIDDFTQELGTSGVLPRLTLFVSASKQASVANFERPLSPAGHQGKLFFAPDNWILVASKAFNDDDFDSAFLAREASVLDAVSKARGIELLVAGWCAIYFKDLGGFNFARRTYLWLASRTF